MGRGRVRNDGVPSPTGLLFEDTGDGAAAPLPPRDSRVPDALVPADTLTRSGPRGLARDANGRFVPGLERPAAPAVGLRAQSAQARTQQRGGFAGPVLAPHELHEAAEQRLLQQNGGRGVLAAYGSFDPRRRPVVVVHGLAGSPEDLADLARELDARGMQVLVFCYDDEGKRAHLSGDQLAAELQRLRQLYGERATLDVVAHSMGGIVTRCALNTLARPGWYDESGAAGEARPRAGFAHVRVRTLDTAWAGYPHEPMLSAAVEALMDATGNAGAVDMRGNSQMFRRLFDVPLEGVDLQNTPAYQIPGIHDPDAHRSIDDLSLAELQALTHWLCGGELPRHEAARHLALSLQQDSRFSELERRVRQARREGRLSQARELVSIVHAVMPPAYGTHMSILRERPHRRDLVDRVADELAGR